MNARLTVSRAAEASARHPETVRDALRSEELHGIQRVKRGKWLIDPECLEAWLAGDPCPHKASNVKDLNKYRKGAR